MPRSRARQVNYKTSSPFKRLIKIIAIVVLIIVFVIGAIMLIFGRNFNNNIRFVLASSHDDGKTVLSIFDAKAHKITLITIPANTEVTAARQLGTWKMGSIRRLGDQEKIAGKLVSETITRTFSVPVDAWADDNAEGLFQANPVKAIQTIFRPIGGSMSLGEKISLALFASKITSSDIAIVDLADSGDIYPAKLRDGEDGYKTRDNLSPRVRALFVDPVIATYSPKVRILNSAGGNTIAAEVSDVLEVIGANVLSISEKESEGECEVTANQREVAKRIAHIWDCSISSSAPLSNFDVELTLGKDFMRRF